MPNDGGLRKYADAVGYGINFDWLTSEVINTETATVGMNQESVNHPAHYGGADNPYECIKVIEAWQLGFCLGNAVKYISRAGRKDPAKTVEDLRKASWYLNHEIKKLSKGCGE